MMFRGSLSLILAFAFLCSPAGARQRDDRVTKSKILAENALKEIADDPVDLEHAKRWLAFLEKRYDSVTAFVEDLQRGPTEFRPAPTVTYNGHTLNLTSLIYFLGPDPKTRSLRPPLLPIARTDAERAVHDLTAEIAATAAFIYAGYDKIHYSRKTAYTGRELLSTVLPFVSNLELRNDLLLKVLKTSRNADEFLALAAIYLHEIDSQHKYHTNPPVTLEQAWNHIRELSRLSKEDLETGLFLLPGKTLIGMDFFKREKDAVNPAQWTHDVLLEKAACEFRLSRP